MRANVFALLLFLLPILHSDFLVGNGIVGQKIWVLCENETSIFIAQPDGKGVEVRIPPEDSQAFFVPEIAGPYAVQCGKETRQIDVSSALPGEPPAEPKQDWALVALLFALFLIILGGMVFIARKILSEKIAFTKSVEGGKAELFLRCEKRMEKLEISDPVAIGFSGEPFAFSIPALEAGKSWSFEYEIEDGERALPASLKFLDAEREVSMLSRLYIGGKGKKETSSKENAAGMKRKIRKAD